MKIRSFKELEGMRSLHVRRLQPPCMHMPPLCWFNQHNYYSEYLAYRTRLMKVICMNVCRFACLKASMIWAGGRVEGSAGLLGQQYQAVTAVAAASTAVAAAAAATAAAAVPGGSRSRSSSSSSSSSSSRCGGWLMHQC
jgi:hypothetical protein